ncbi:MAG TPA: cation transporter [Methylomirabilota bacterium]|nr:cation transporter [Methylomirabilota bacterium]
MKDCCDAAASELTTLRERQRHVLQVVLAINTSMFLVEFGAGLVAHSTALLADSLDMLGDAFVYAFSLYVLGRGSRWQARAALLKGSVMAAFGIGVVAEVILKALRGVVPTAELIGGIGLLALAANLACLGLLLRHRHDDLNLRSTWLCSRNDVIANVGVLIAATGVALTGSAWPDILIGAVIAGVFAASAAGVLRDARRQLRAIATG